MDEDSTLIYNKIVELGGSLGFTDKADPEVIKKYFNMSKNAFKSRRKAFETGKGCYYREFNSFKIIIVQKQYFLNKDNYCYTI